MQDDKIEKYYNEFFKHKENVQVNERIYACYKKMIKHGLVSSSTLLELGCGPGALTWLVSRKIKSGFIEATDLSPYAIDFAKQHINNKNVFLYTGDVVKYKPQHAKSFDFITLFDVLEHIPMQQHEKLFANITTYMHSKTLLLINIPNPQYIEYDEVHQPETLQVIDQAIYINHLSEVLMKNELLIESMSTNSIWVKDDYHFYMVKKKTTFEEIKLSAVKTFGQKIFSRLKHIYITRVLKYS